MLRPADILTSATRQGRLTALDIGISSPFTCTAGSDCVGLMFECKCRRYAEHVSSDLDFDCVPLTFSSFGRIHPECMSILKCVSKLAARKRGVLDARDWNPVFIEISVLKFGAD